MPDEITRLRQQLIVARLDEAAAAVDASIERLQALLAQLAADTKKPPRGH